MSVNSVHTVCGVINATVTENNVDHRMLPQPASHAVYAVTQVQTVTFYAVFAG